VRLPRQRWVVGGALFAALLAVAGTFALADRSLPAPLPIRIEASPIPAFDNRDAAQLRFGELQFRGGIALTSKNEAFGGISGLHIDPDGAHFLAVSDRGSWLRGRIVYEKGVPVGIADAEMAPMLGADGKPMAPRGAYDAEALTLLDGKFYVGIERVEQIVRFDINRDGLAARGEPVAVPPDFKTLAHNKSLECLAAAPKGSALDGSLIAVTERSLDSDGNLRSFLIKGDQFERFSIKRSDDFDISDCTVLPPGDLLLLERRYSPARGVAMRIRRVPLSAIKPGALVDGKPMIEADMAFQVDNMEGIAVHRNAEGETVITLVSDDNFSIIQRNLLLQFTLVGE
jgi:hypothetical protein